MNMANIFPNAVDEAQGDTARRILDAAYALFLDFGFRRMTMEDVAKRVGVSRITIYRHYRDKDALFQAVALREGRRTLRHIQLELASVSKPEELFVESFVLSARQARNHPLIKRLLETEPEWLLPHLTIKSGMLFQLAVVYCSNFLRSLQMADQIQNIPIELVAEILVRLLQSAVLTPGGLMASDKEEDLRQVAHLLFSASQRHAQA
ncbi:MAG: TetR/AcrR family transcriptional regulator [Moraxellaceae bacterium]